MKLSFLWFTLGVVTGVIISNFGPSHGTLKIDRSDPEKDRHLFMIEEKVLDKLHTKKRITLKVDGNANLSDFSQN